MSTPIVEAITDTYKRLRELIPTEPAKWVIAMQPLTHSRIKRWVRQSDKWKAWGCDAKAMRRQRRRVEARNRLVVTHHLKGNRG